MHHQDFTRSFDFHYLISRKKWTDSVLQRIDCVKIADFLLKREKSTSFVIHSYLTFSFMPIIEILQFSLYPLLSGTKTFQRISKVAVSNAQPLLNSSPSPNVSRQTWYIKYFFSSRLLWSRNYRWTRSTMEREREGDRITGNKRKSDEEGNKIENKENK